MIKTSIVITNFNTKRITENCLKSVFENNRRLNLQLIIVDNGSKDDSVSFFKQLNVPKNIDFNLIENEKNMGFAKANNQGIKIAKGKYILLLNSDTLVNGEIISEMVSWLDKNLDIGVAGCELRNEDGTLQGSGGYTPNLIRVFSWMFFLDDIPLIDRLIKPFHPFHEKSPIYQGEVMFTDSQERDWITGAFFMVRKEVFDDIGFFDEEYFMYVEEVDFCYRAKKAGWKVWYNPKWHIIHYGGASGTGTNAVIMEFEGIKRFFRKFFPLWQYHIVGLLLKLGSLFRIFVFSLLGKRDVAKTYEKAFVSV